MDLKELRKNKGFTQEFAAKIANFPLRTYKRIESDSSYKNSLKYITAFDKISKAKTHESSAKFGKRKITIIGAGFVGLSSGVVLSKKFDVEFVDINPKVRNKIKKETGLNVFSSIEDISDFDFVLICLPTNFNDKKQHYESDAIEDAVKRIDSISNEATIIVRSTISIGSTNHLSKLISRQVYFMPEFLREKTALYDANNPSRIVFGADRFSKLINSFISTYLKCLENNPIVLKTSTKEAEAIKLYSNAYLATRIAFFNELDTFARKEGLDSKLVIDGMGLDPRIGDYYNKPGFGYGGYCLPKDTKALKAQTKGELLKGVVQSNEMRKENIANEIIGKAMKMSQNPVIGFYGINSKRTGNSYRPSSTLDLINILKNKNVKFIVFDKDYDDSIGDFKQFVKISTIIVTEKIDDRLKSVSEKIFR